MKPALLIVVLSLALMPLASLAGTPSGNETTRDGATGFAIPTFHCLGLYWSPPGGAADKEVLVRYRSTGTSAWNEGLPMRYHPIWVPTNGEWPGCDSGSERDRDSWLPRRCCAR